MVQLIANDQGIAPQSKGEALYPEGKTQSIQVPPGHQHGLPVPLQATMIFSPIFLEDTFTLQEPCILSIKFSQEDDRSVY